MVNPEKTYEIGHVVPCVSNGHNLPGSSPFLERRLIPPHVHWEEYPSMLDCLRYHNLDARSPFT